MPDILNIRPEEYFYLSNGQSIKSLSELKDALPKLDEGVFSNHVNKEKNDFASWIRGVFKEEGLADQVASEKEKRKMAVIIERFLDKKKHQKIPLLEKLMPEKSEAEKAEPQKAAAETAPEEKNKQAELEIEKSEFNVLKDRLGEIMKRELEIQKREEKIQQVEEDLEKKLSGGERKFFTKEFVEGLLTGILILLIVGLVILKFSPL
jgi:hypothetical protein